MAARKYLRNDAGRIREESAVQTSAGVADGGKIVALDDSGRLAEGMMPVGFGRDQKVLTASENLSAGDLVNIWDDAGTAKMRKSDATAEGKEAVGFVLEAVTTGNTVPVLFEGTNTQLSGLTPGARYYVSTTPGGVTATPPNAAGNIVQYVGRAVSATELSFEPSDAITLV